MEHDSRSTFGKLLRRLRRAANLSQEALAERARMSVVTVGALERGIRRSPYRETIDLLLAALAPNEEQAAELIAAAEAERRKGRPAPEPLPMPDPTVLDTAAIRSNASFTGRTEDLVAIESAFEGGAEVVALSGMGGVGKTTLAREYAWRARERYAVAWRLAAHTEAGIIADLIRLGANLVRGFENVEDQKAAALEVRDHLLPGLARPVLLIFDNLEDEAMLWEWRPPTGARVLVTARMRTWSGGAAVVPLGVWSRSEALEYLRREGDLGDAGDGADALAEALGDLPLALAHAAAYLRATRTVSPEVYAARIARYLGRTPRGAEYERAVFATFQAALAQAEEDAPGSAALLCLAAFFAPDAIPDELLRRVPEDGALRPVLPDGQESADLRTTAADPILVDEALGALDRLSLMTYAPATKSFSAHRLVQAAARDLIAGATSNWICAGVAAIADAFPEMGLQNWSGFDPLVPHALVVVKHATDAKVDNTALRSVLSACGTYLFRRGRDAEGRPLLEHAVDGYRAALQEYPRERTPMEWARTQHNLGIALTTLGERDSGTARLEEAVAAFRAALGEHSRESVPLEWARTQRNLGIAVRKLGEREIGTAGLEEAAAAFRAALEELTRERAPMEWATTQQHLGSALWSAGERESGTARLEAAAAACRAALEELTRERAPLEWAWTQHNLAGVLWRLGEREGGTARLEEAVAACRAALEERTRDRVPLQWAWTQSNLGSALCALGERESGTARLEEAVAAYSAALEEHTRVRVPLGWAMIQHNLGDALRTLGERESGTARLEAAVAACRAALEERTREREPVGWAMSQHNLGDALRTLGERESGTARLEGAVAAYRAALEVCTREREPLEWARIQGNLGNALRTLGERESGTVRLEEAVAAWRAAIEELTRERVPLEWARTQHGLADALIALGERSAAIGQKNLAYKQFREAVLAAEAAEVVFNESAVEHLVHAVQRSVERSRRAYEAAGLVSTGTARR